MWRSATKNVCNVPGGTALAWSAIEDIAPITGLYKRFVENRAAASQPATPNGHPAVPVFDQPSTGTPSAAQLAFAEWSRQADVHKPALAREPLAVMPLGSQLDQQPAAATVLGSFWQQEQLPVLQTDMQDPCSSHQGSEAAAAATAVNRTGLVQTGELQGQAGLAGELPATTAGAAALAAAALLENIAADDTLITRPIPQHVSPFMLSAPAALPSADPAAGPGGLSTQHGPFPGVLMPAWDAAQQQQHQQQQLHAPAVLPEFRLAGPQTLAGGLGPAAVPSTPPCSPPALALQDMPGLTAATIAAAAAMGTDPVSAWPTGGAGAPAAFCFQPAAPQTCCNTAGSTPGDSSAGTTQYCSPFSLMAPWALDPPAANLVAAAGDPGVQDAGDMLLQGLWPIEQPISRLAGRAGAGSNLGRVVKRQGKAREHSSVKQRKLLKELQARHAALLEEYEGYLALNATLQQHWSEVAAAAAAAGVAEAAALPSSTAAADAIDALDNASASNVLAELVHQDWTSVLIQMVQLLPSLDSSSSSSHQGGVASQDQRQQQEQEQVGPAATSCTAATLIGAYQPDNALPSPFMAAAAGDVAGGCAATGAVSAESAAAHQLSIPVSCLMSGFLSSLPTKSQSGRPDQGQRSTGSNGLKRRHKGAGAESQRCTEQLSLLLSTNLSLGPPNAKQPRLGGGDSLAFTESELRAIFSLGSSKQPQQQQLLLPVNAQDQQVSMGQDQVAGQQQQQQGADSTQGLSISPAAALQSATSLYGGLCELFERVGLAGPSVLYRCFGPKAAYCPCCSPAEVPAVLGQGGAAGAGAGCAGLQEGHAGASRQHQQQDQSLLALLLARDDSVGAAAVVAVGGAAMVEGVGDPVLPARHTYATPAHWQRVVDSLSLTPEQEANLVQLWSGVQSSHNICFDSRQRLLHALQQQQEVIGRWPGVAAYGSCQAGEAMAVQVEQLLADVSDTLAADCGLLLEASKRLWGDKSPLTLVQKVKCLVNSYPFWPDYDLLACMASSRTATA